MGRDQRSSVTAYDRREKPYLRRHGASRFDTENHATLLKCSDRKTLDLRKKSDEASRSGTFTLGPGRELYGELTLAGPRTFLYLDDKDKFLIDSLPDRHVTGVLRDRTKVSLLKCIPQRYSSGDRSGEAHYSAEIFPHFVVVGDHHVHPNDQTISVVYFRVDDGTVLFWDFDANGWLIDARPLAEQVANANAGVTGRRVAIGPNPEIFYFSGKEEIVTASTAFGAVSVQQHLQRNLFSSDRKARLRIEISIEFEPAVNFDEAIFRMSGIAEYLGMLVGRPQNVLDCWVRNKPEPEEPPLRVHWSMPLRRDKESESPRPSIFDILMNAAVQPEEFKLVLEGWVGATEGMAWGQKALFQLVSPPAVVRYRPADRLCQHVRHSAGFGAALRHSGLRRVEKRANSRSEPIPQPASQRRTRQRPGGPRTPRQTQPQAEGPTQGRADR
jgi:hypothetical protein